MGARCCPNADKCECDPCGVSTRKAKTEISYLTPTDEATLSAELAELRLASYRYRGDLDDGRTHVGYILEDSPAAASSDLARSRVDLYTYTSMAVAAIHAQDRRIDALELELRDLKARQDRLEGKRQ